MFNFHTTVHNAAEKIILAFNGKPPMTALEAIAGCEILLNCGYPPRTDNELRIHEACAGLVTIGARLEAMRLAHNAILNAETVLDCNAPGMAATLEAWRKGETRGNA